MGADWSKKVVNKGFRENRIAISKPNRSHRKANLKPGDNYVTAEKVRNAYLGLGMNHETQVGKLKSLRSYWKYLRRLQTPRGVRRKAVQGQWYCAERAYSGIHHRLRSCSSKWKRTTAITRSGRIQRNKNLSKKQPYKTAVLICILNKYLVV